MKTRFKRHKSVIAASINDTSFTKLYCGDKTPTEVVNELTRLYKKNIFKVAVIAPETRPENYFDQIKFELSKTPTRHKPLQVRFWTEKKVS